ncbi:MAG: 2-hydroxyacid dehydrogenase [Bacteroidota bacterium]
MNSIAFFSTKPYDQTYFEAANSDFGYELHFYEPKLNLDTYKLAEGAEAICAFVNDDLKADVLTALAGLGVKVLLLRCAGFNNVDLKAANSLGLKVYRVPAYSPYAVAEHAVALILTLSRKTHKAFNRVREGNFSLERLTGFDLNAKTVGVIGTGTIGRVFIQIMRGFGCRVLAYDPYPSEAAKALGATYVELSELYAQSDIISLHCPLTPETRYLINEAAFSQMKDGVMLINTSRGQLIDTQQAISALKHQKLGYLGIDVYEQEEQLFFSDFSETIIQDDLIMRLMTFPNVLVTAHQGFFTKEALTQIAQTSLQNLADWQAGKSTKNEVSFQEKA